MSFMSEMSNHLITYLLWYRIIWFRLWCSGPCHSCPLFCLIRSFPLWRYVFTLCFRLSHFSLPRKPGANHPASFSDHSEHFLSHHTVQITWNGNLLFFYPFFGTNISFSCLLRLLYSNYIYSGFILGLLRYSVQVSFCFSQLLFVPFGCFQFQTSLML
jgi:hypothetical protein